ncbi:MAG: tetratricopeptide repeat protein [Deltaproteobacteria bacterium]|nr:tetratricopeptide repeat protein [Deltaproteobacteria bacterium]
MLRDLFYKNIYAIALLGLFVAVVYYNALFTPFMWDDKTLVLYNTGIKGGLESVLSAFSPRLWGLRVDNDAFRSFYRPLHTILSMLDYRIWGLNPFGFHLTNVIVHFLNTILVFVFALKLTEERITSFIAAAVFAVHPVHTESVTFISARVDLLCAFFLLLSFQLFAFHPEPGYKQFGRGFGLRDILSMFFFMLALLSKEMAVTMPILLAIYAWFFEKWGRRLVRVAPYFIILALYIVFRVFGLSSFTGQHKLKADFITLAFTSSVAVFDYIRLLFFPYPLKAYYSIFWQTGLSVRVILAFLLLLISGAGVLFYLARDKRLHAFSILWTFVSLLPVLNIGTLGEFSIAERYLYIPSIGFSIFLGLVFNSLLKEKILSRFVPYAAAAVIIVLGVLTIQRNRVWGDDVTFYAAMVKGAPDSPIPHANLGHAYLRAGDTEGAIRELQAATALSNGNHILHYELGSLYIKSRRLDSAVAELLMAVELKPDFSEAYNALGIAYAEMGRFDLAAAEFEKVLGLDPSSKIALTNLEKARAQVGIKKKARIR